MALTDFVKGIFKSSKQVAQVVNEQDFLENAEKAYLQHGKIRDTALRHADTARFGATLEKQGEVLGKKISAYNSITLPDTSNMTAKAVKKAAAKTAKKVTQAKAELTNAYNTIARTMEQATKQIGEAKSFGRGQAVGRVLKSKFFLVPAALVAAAVVGAKIFSAKKRHDREELVENRNQQIDAVRSEVDTLRGGNTMMGMQPAPGDHAARVAAGRGGAAAGIDTSNPAMSAASYDVVRS